MTEPTVPETGPEAKFRANLLLQWFVFPMIAVAIGVGLYLSFRFLTAENKTTEDYLNDLRSGNPHRAWQAAFAIANEVNLGRLGESETPGVGRDFLAMLRESSPGAGEIRHYFILTLGRLKYAEAAPKLIDIAGATDATEKIYALIALGEMRSIAAVDAAAAALQDPDAGVRKTAAHFFGVMGRVLPADADVPSRLRPLLNDPVVDVRWNAALSLSEYGDPAAVPVLKCLLDRRGVEREIKSAGGLDETNLEKIILAALSASTHYRDPELQAGVRALAEHDPRAAVQLAARQALERMKEMK